VVVDGGVLWLTLCLGASFEEHRRGLFYEADDIADHRLEKALGCVVDLGIGTGFAVSPEHVLTNVHIADELGAETLGLLGRGPGEGELVELSFVEGRQDLDLALYELGEPVACAFEVRERGPVKHEPVAVVGHPGRRSARVSYGRVLSTDLHPGGVPTVEYDAQTDWGSSGSAVLDSQGRLIALHYAWDGDQLYNGWMLGVPLAEARASWPLLDQVLEPYQAEPSTR
jgi:S1-C subfamily serine protease